MKESYYFPHDYNAKSDQKMLILRGEYGLEGYALFFMILEDMAQDTYGYLNRVAIGGLSIGYGVPKEKTTEIINFCIEIGLFCEDKNGIYSKRMIEHKTYRKDLSEAGKQGAKKRWENRGAISHPISTPNAKERKGKEIKRNNIEDILLDKIFIDERGLDLLEEFVNHRSETDKHGKQKRQKQNTWDIKKRLFTWKKNRDTNFGRKKALDYELLENFHKGAMSNDWDTIKDYFIKKYGTTETTPGRKIRQDKYGETKTKRKASPLFLEAIK